MLVFILACTGTDTIATTTTLERPPLTLGTTTTAPPLPVELQSCSAPPVTFSTLCETVELLDEWYVNRPVQFEELAAIALEAVVAFETDETEEPPRTLFCAIPDPSFEEMCHTLAERVDNENLPVGPAMESVVTSMIDIGLDPFTWYIPPELSKGLRSDGIIGGVGLLLDATDAAGSKCARIGPACPLKIVLVLEGNAGDEAGLMVGDIITSVDGENVDGKGFVNTATLIGGDETGVVELTIDRDGEMIDFSIERAAIQGPSLEVELPRPGVGYLRIPDFSASIPFVVRTAVDSLVANQVGTIVIDLRDNPGGLVNAVISVASEFISDGNIMATTGPDEEFDYPALGNARATSQRLIVLVNEGTASAAEILAGALNDRRNATVLGQNTFGKNAVQIPFELRNGGEFHVAIAHWTTPNGTSVVDGGLTPDRIVDFPAGLTIEELVDLALESA